MWAGRIRHPTAGSCSTGLKWATSGGTSLLLLSCAALGEMGCLQYIMDLWVDARTPVCPM